MITHTPFISLGRSCWDQDYAIDYSSFLGHGYLSIPYIAILWQGAIHRALGR